MTRLYLVLALRLWCFLLYQFFFGTDSIFSTSMPPVLAFAIYNFTSTTVSFILLSVNIFATSNHILNLTLRVIWTVIQGIAVIILTLQAISPGLIYGEPKIDHWIVIIINHFIWIPGLLIIIPMFIYGIIESGNLNRVRHLEQGMWWKWFRLLQNTSW